MRPDDEEDACAAAAARGVAAAHAAGVSPHFLWNPNKAPRRSHRRPRAAHSRSLPFDARGRRRRPSAELRRHAAEGHVARAASALADLSTFSNRASASPAGSLRFELMVETPQSIFGADGRVVLPDLVRAGRGRCVVGALRDVRLHRRLRTSRRRASAWRTRRATSRSTSCRCRSRARGSTLSDGATNVLPVGPPRAEGGPLPAAHLEENRRAVHRAGGSTTKTSAIRWRAGSIRAGTFTPHSSRPVSPQYSNSS